MPGRVGIRDATAAVIAAMVLSLALATTTPAVATDRAFELRIYTAAEGKLEALHRRFRDHTIGLFEKHGMTVVGFWTPKEEGADNTLVYLLAYPSHEARSEAWKAFIDDPEWKRVYAESQKDGRLVAKVESKMLAPTDYSPMK